MKNQDPKQLSRRNLLETVAAIPIACAAISILPNAATAQAKVPKSAVAYQDHPKGAQECTNCSLFQPPNACKNVAGDISPKGWCNIWVKKG